MHNSYLSKSRDRRGEQYELSVENDRSLLAAGLALIGVDRCCHKWCYTVLSHPPLVETSRLVSFTPRNSLIGVDRMRMDKK